MLSTQKMKNVDNREHTGTSQRKSKVVSVRVYIMSHTRFRLNLHSVIT